MLKNFDYFGIEYLIPIGGDDALSYGARLHYEGMKVIAISKTMDNDVPGTAFCIGSAPASRGRSRLRTASAPPPDRTIGSS